MGKKKFKRSKEMFPLMKSYLAGKQARIDFCKEHEIKLHVFNYWLGLYRKSIEPTSTDFDFAKITIVEPAKLIAQEITIQCANGVTIKIPL